MASSSRRRSDVSNSGAHRPERAEAVDRPQDPRDLLLVSPDEDTQEAARRAERSEEIRRFHALRDSLLGPPEEDTDTDETVESSASSSGDGESSGVDESEGDEFSGVRAVESSSALVEPDRWDACVRAWRGSCASDPRCPQTPRSPNDPWWT